MTHPTRRLLLVATALLLVGVGGSARPAAVDLPTERTEVARIHEVRLRKFHMVRPDLIPYPIAREVYC